MAFFRWLQSLFAGGSHAAAGDAVVSAFAQVCEIADRLERCADRFANAGDRDAEADARTTAEEVRRITDVAEAKRREVQFYRRRGLTDDGRSLRPQVGTAGDSEYVRYGSTVRRGGSKGWRYNNPGYVRCSDRATYYGATGCDGEVAIFPDMHTGRRAYMRTIREDHPQRTVEEVVREQMPPAEADAMLATLGGTAAVKVSDLTDADCEAVAAAGAAAVESGGSFDRDSPDAPDWAGEIWDNPSKRAMDGDTSGDHDGARPSDDS